MGQSQFEDEPMGGIQAGAPASEAAPKPSEPEALGPAANSSQAHALKLGDLTG